MFSAHICKSIDSEVILTCLQFFLRGGNAARAEMVKLSKKPCVRTVFGSSKIIIVIIILKWITSYVSWVLAKSGQLTIWCIQIIIDLVLLLSVIP